MKLYVAGPMRGRPEFNFPAFLGVDERLHALGHDTYNPAVVDIESGFDYRGTTGHEDLTELGFDLRAALAGCLEFICRDADGVVVLPGWEASRGAVAEVATAQALSLPVYALVDFGGAVRLVHALYKFQRIGVLS